MARARADYELRATDKTGAAFASVGRRVEQSRKLLTQFTAATAAIGAVGSLAIVGYGLRLAEVGDQLQKATIRTGIAAEELSALHQVARLNDASAEAFNSAIFKMNRNLGEAAEGTKEQKEALAALGLEVHDLLAMSPDERFLAIADALNQTADDSELATKGTALLGRGVETLTPLIRQGRKAIEEYTASLRDNPLWTQEQADAAANIQDDFTEISATVTREGAKMLPMLEKLTSGLNDFAAGASSLVASDQVSAISSISSAPLGFLVDAVTGGIDEAAENLRTKGADILDAFGMDELAASMRPVRTEVDAIADAMAAAGQSAITDFIDPVGAALDAMGITPGKGKEGAFAFIAGGELVDARELVNRARSILSGGALMQPGEAGRIGLGGAVDAGRFVAGADSGLARPQKVEDPESRRLLARIEEVLRSIDLKASRPAGSILS